MNDIEQNAEKIQARVLVFLRAIGLSPELRARMTVAGYSEEEHRIGWVLVGKASGFVDGPDPFVKHTSNKLAQWRAKGCLRLRKVLAVRHPEQEAFVFDGIHDATDDVSAVATILDRLDALEGVGAEAEKRAAHACADRKALAMLEACNIGKELRRELRDHVRTARGVEVSAHELAAHRTALETLRNWYEDWSTVAGLIFEKPGHLIRLGVVERKAGRPRSHDQSHHAKCATSKTRACTRLGDQAIARRRLLRHSGSRRQLPRRDARMADRTRQRHRMTDARFGAPARRPWSRRPGARHRLSECSPPSTSVGTLAR